MQLPGLSGSSQAISCSGINRRHSTPIAEFNQKSSNVPPTSFAGSACECGWMEGALGVRCAAPRGSAACDGGPSCISVTRGTCDWFPRLPGVASFQEERVGGISGQERVHVSQTRNTREPLHLELMSGLKSGDTCWVNFVSREGFSKWEIPREDAKGTGV